jgi:hypothetical protein
MEMLLLRKLLDRLPYVGQLRECRRIAGAFPPGHFYSPIPDRGELEIRLQLSRGSEQRTCPEIDYNHDAQFERLKAFAGFYGDLPFPQHQSGECRYYYEQTAFTYTDAIFLYSFLRHTQPQRIIEVGSGFSSAVTLDTVERFFKQRPQLTFIEPYPVRLKQLLREYDTNAVSVIEDKVQNSKTDLFACLQPGDLLFIDSSHVLKYGSDLQFLLFSVLPLLPAGTFVHFHDVFSGFEYPAEWLRQGWYWNEDYLLRAFLAHNANWKVCFFNNYARYAFEPFLKEHMPLCLNDIGGSLYIQKVRDDARLLPS